MRIENILTLGKLGLFSAGFLALLALDAIGHSVTPAHKETCAEVMEYNEKHMLDVRRSLDDQFALVDRLATACSDNPTERNIIEARRNALAAAMNARVPSGEAAPE
jgi:hypothetical protein